jgi:hypothetical protein
MEFKMSQNTVQKLMSLENRLREWREARRGALATVVAITLVLVPLSSMIVSWVFRTLIGIPVTFNDALILALLAAIPLFVFMPNAISGPRPTPRDVLVDQALRRAAGLPDDVED